MKRFDRSHLGAFAVLGAFLFGLFAPRPGPATPTPIPPDPRLELFRQRQTRADKGYEQLLDLARILGQVQGDSYRLTEEELSLTTLPGHEFAEDPVLHAKNASSVRFLKKGSALYGQGVLAITMVYAFDDQYFIGQSSTDWLTEPNGEVQVIFNRLTPDRSSYQVVRIPYQMIREYDYPEGRDLAIPGTPVYEKGENLLLPPPFMVNPKFR